VLDYQLGNKDEADQKITIKGHCHFPELKVDIQQNFQQDSVSKLSFFP
jgi:hypothetical protein